MLARALACPSAPTKRMCPPDLPPPSFHCLFIPAGAPPQCQVRTARMLAPRVRLFARLAPAQSNCCVKLVPLCAQDTATCMADEACWAPLLTPPPVPNTTADAATDATPAAPPTRYGRLVAWLRSMATRQPDAANPRQGDAPPAPLAQISVVADEAAAMDRALERPERVDALVLFDAAPPAPSPSSAGGAEEQQVGRGTARREEAVGRRLRQRLEAALRTAVEANDLFEGGLGSDAAHALLRTGGAGDGSESPSGAGLTASGAAGAGAGAGGGGASAELLRFTIRMNHTDVPDTRWLLDLFEVVPSRTNGLALYQR